MTSNPGIKSIKADSPHFVIRDNLCTSARASLEISKDCPLIYVKIIQNCYEKGWLKPVANVTAEEYMLMQLSQ
jgi:hypothetical protein